MGAAAAKGSVMKCAVGDLGRENSCANSSHWSTGIVNCSTPLVMAGGYSPPRFIPSARAQVRKCPRYSWCKGTAHPQPHPRQGKTGCIIHFLISAKTRNYLSFFEIPPQIRKFSWRSSVFSILHQEAFHQNTPGPALPRCLTGSSPGLPSDSEWGTTHPNLPHHCASLNLDVNLSCNPMCFCSLSSKSVDILWF